MYLCICKGISDKEVSQLGSTGCVGQEDLISVLGLTDDECCGRCADEIEPFLMVAAAGARCATPCLAVA